MTVANSRGDRDKTIGQLAGLSRSALLHELVDATVTAQAIAEESREVRHRRADNRVYLELIALELTSRQAGDAAPHELHPTAAAS